MPTVSQQQAEALRALDWLYSEEDADRRSGRSLVLAVSLLRRGFSMRVEWVAVEDHVSTRDADRFLLGQIQDLAERLGISIEIRRQRSTQPEFRVLGSGPGSRDALFNDFVEGDIELGLSPERLSELAAMRAPASVLGRELGTLAPPKAPEPEALRRSAWEHLVEAD